MFSPLKPTTMIFLFLIMGVMPTTSCTEKKVEIILRMDVKTNQGDLVSDAEVKVDGELVGQSDAKGQLAVKLMLPAKSRKKIEVTKQSDKYYFAPFFESFEVPETAKDIPVIATLFFVPKPEADAKDGDSVENGVGNELDGVGKKENSTNNGVASANSKAPASKDEQSSGVVSEGGSQSDDDQGPYPKPLRIAKGPLAFTILVVEDDGKNESASHGSAQPKPIGDALVFFGSEESGDLKLACKTNVRGRCVVRFPERPEGAITFVGKKNGFLTHGEAAEIVEEGSLQLALKRGETIDIFATTRTYNYLKGLSGVEVMIKGKSAGITDSFGRLSYGYSGRHNELLSVALRSSDYLPEKFETDFVVSGPMTLVRYFAPREAPAVKVTLLKAQPGSNLSATDIAAFDGILDQSIGAAVRRNLYSQPSFIEFPAAEFGKVLRSAGMTMGQAVKKGWINTDLKAAVDAVILPAISMQDTPVLEMNLIDSKGVVLAAAREKLDSLKDEAAINRSVQVLAAKITRAFPFEGAVIGKESKYVTINIGGASGRGLSIGDRAEIHGIQMDARGKNQVQKRIALVQVKDIFEQTARCEVLSTEPRSVVSRGDLVVLRPRNGAPALASSVRVVFGSGSGAKSVGQANVYLDDTWVGATDDSGRMQIDSSRANGQARVVVTKLGYKPFSADINFSKPKRLDVTLKRDAAYVRVDSKPPGATVRFDGVVVGKTPFTAPVAVAGGFTKIQIEGPAEFKKYEAVLELDEGTLDLTGANSVSLERNYVGQAQKLIATKPEAAIAMLAEIPTDHSDYLLGRHVTGEIYLSNLNEPAKAVEAFSTVTKSEAVAEFNDKRFIGSHVNEGIALFLVAERLKDKSPEAALSHYLKCIQVLDRVVPQLRFVPPTDYAQAVHNVDYYRALARHRTWTISKDRVALADAYRAWRDYVEGAAKSVPLNATTKPLAENAAVYYRQVQSSLLTQPK